MSRELPQPGQLWRHFKGGEYWVIAIAHMIGSSNIAAKDKTRVIYSNTYPIWDNRLEAKCFDTESPTILNLRQSGSSEPSMALFLLIPTNEAWHPSDKTESTLWARPLDNFMSIVSSPHGTESSNCYRFERITTPTPSHTQL